MSAAGTTSPRLSRGRTLGALVLVAVGSVLTAGTWSATIQDLRRIDGRVVEHGPRTRTAACEIVMQTQASRTILWADEAGCAALPIGARVRKDAWSLKYTTDRGTIWKRSAAQFWLGGVLGSLFIAAWLAGVPVILVWPLWRRIRRR